MKKFVVVLLAVIFIFYLFLLVYGDFDNPTAKQGSETPSGTSGSISQSTQQTQQIEKNVQEAVNSGGDISTQTSEPITITAKDGSKVTLKGNIQVEKGKITAGYLKTGDTEANDVKGFQKTTDGYTLNFAKSLTQGKNKVINGKGIRFKNGVLIVDEADSFIKDNSITTNILNLNSEEDIFSVEQADSFLSDCIRVDNIKDSEFKISNNVEVTTKSNVNLKITDCTFNEYQFSGKGRVTVDKSINNPRYIIENGTLTKKENGYNESAESNNSIIVETDKTFGFKCLIINPVGSYFYNDNDLRKDFSINVPKESSVYRLCLRKNAMQQFKDYNGLADFVSKNIELNKIVNYLRYPLKNNQISSILSDFVYKGLKDINTILSYDNDLIFLNNILIKNKNNLKDGTLSVTYPSNYYTIKETEVAGEIHSIIELNLKTKKQDLTQNINYEYKTDYFEPKLSIKGNVLMQDNGKNRLLILPPEHEKISELLR